MKRSIVFRALAVIGLIAFALGLIALAPAPARDVGSTLALAHASPLTLPAGGLIPTQLVSALTSASQEAEVVVSTPARQNAFEVLVVNLAGASTSSNQEAVPLRPDPGNARAVALPNDLLAQPPNDCTT